ncbi:MAG: preprotein translocase subunit SecE [Planctomycetaceae bacterium]|jgi:preprotein translocase subunit SecE|nr:preprotein translocase subunit SecE [Planctomycetaceae bacterium]
MATTKSKGSQTLLSEMFSSSLYKRNQGRRVRQWTGVAVAAVFVLGAMSLYNSVLADMVSSETLAEGAQSGVAFGLALAGIWFAYRLVNYPRFADFLISVQAEMDKVTWVSWKELIRSTIVVIVCMSFIGILLYLYDYLWAFLFRLVDVLKV